MQSCALRRRGASAYPLQAVTRDECRAYLVWQHCFSPVFITNLFSLSCRRGVGGRTIRAYSFYVTYCKHTNARTAQPAVCPPPMYKIMYKKFEGRVSRRPLNAGLRSAIAMSLSTIIVAINAQLLGHLKLREGHPVAAFLIRRTGCRKRASRCALHLWGRGRSKTRSDLSPFVRPRFPSAVGKLRLRNHVQFGIRWCRQFPAQPSAPTFLIFVAAFKQTLLGRVPKSIRPRIQVAVFDNLDGRANGFVRIWCACR